MVLLGILNGYYRSGTTIWMRIIDESNPNIAVLSEPTSPVVVEQIESKGFNGIESLHGWNIFRGYGKLRKETFYEYCRRWREIKSKYKTLRGIMTSWDDVKYLLEPFINCSEKVLIKSNQLHFFLHRIEKELGVPCLHLERNLADNVAGHLSIGCLMAKSKANEIFNAKEADSTFFVDSVYNNIKEMLNFDFEVERVIDKLIVNITICNRFAEIKNVTIASFEKFNDVYTKIVRKFNIHIRKHKLNLLEPSKVYIAPAWLLLSVSGIYEMLFDNLVEAEKRFDKIP